MVQAAADPCTSSWVSFSASKASRYASSGSPAPSLGWRAASASRPSIFGRMVSRWKSRLTTAAPLLAIGPRSTVPSRMRPIAAAKASAVLAAFRQCDPVDEPLADAAILRDQGDATECGSLQRRQAEGLALLGREGEDVVQAVASEEFRLRQDALECHEIGDFKLPDHRLEGRVRHLAVDIDMEVFESGRTRSLAAASISRSTPLMRSIRPADTIRRRPAPVERASARAAARNGSSSAGPPRGR